MIVKLERHAYLGDRTMGKMYFGDEVVHTLERPWIPSPLHLGGENFASCIPDGTYTLEPFSSEKHPDCFILHNEELDVLKWDSQSQLGRWAILIHAGNYVKDVVGCIAPGLTADEKNVWHSRQAMDRLRAVLGVKRHKLIISPRGAKN